MMKKYYYEVDGMVQGPVERSGLDSSDPDLRICVKGTQVWFPLSEIDYVPPAPEPPPEQKILSTGGIGWNYVILDAIFALDSHSPGFFKGATNPAKAFDGVKEKLRETCSSMGGDAVINCQFEYRVAGNDYGPFGIKHCVEIFAYGTVVRRMD